MFPSPLTMSPVGSSRCGQPAGCGRLLPALFLSLLLHVLAVLPPLSGAAPGGGEGGASRHEITARLVGVANRDTPEKDRPPEAAYKEEAAPSAPLQGNDSETLAPGTPDREGNSTKPTMDHGPGDGSGELRYFLGDQLTVRPYPLTVLEDPGTLEPEPDGRSDRVVLRIWISDSGEVTGTETEFTDMPARVHDAVVVAFRRMRFMPGEIDGRRVGSILRIEMTYKDFRLPVE